VALDVPWDSHQPFLKVYTAAVRVASALSMGVKEAKAAENGLKVGKELPDAANKLGLSTPAQKMDPQLGSLCLLTIRLDHTIVTTIGKHVCSFPQTFKISHFVIVTTQSKKNSLHNMIKTEHKHTKLKAVCKKNNFLAHPFSLIILSPFQKRTSTPETGAP